MRVREDTSPWYKQFWPWFLISIPLATVVAAIFTIRIAMVSNDGLVVEDYYKEGLAINANKAKEKRAAELGISASVSLKKNGAIEAQLTETPADLTFVTLSLIHPGVADQDLKIPLTHVGNGLYAVQQTGLNPAINWHVMISPPSDEWRLLGRWKPASQQSVTIKSN